MAIGLLGVRMVLVQRNVEEVFKRDIDLVPTQPLLMVGRNVLVKMKTVVHVIRDLVLSLAIGVPGVLIALVQNLVEEGAKKEHVCVTIHRQLMEDPRVLV